MVTMLTRAPKISGEVTKVVDTVQVWPEAIEPGLQSRYNGDPETAANYGHTEESINKMVKSYELYGQQQAVVCRQTGDKKERLELISGYGRWCAATLYNGRHPESPMKLAVKVVEADDEEALLASNEENERRQTTSPLDLAHTQNLFRERFGWTNAKIAEHFNCDPAHVTRLQRILKAPEKVRAFVHEKLLPVQLAYEIAGLDEKGQKEVMARIVKEGKDVKAKWAKLDKHFKDEPEVTPEGGEESAEEPKGGKKKKAGKKAKGPKTAARVGAKAVRQQRQKKAESNGHASGGEFDAPPPTNGKKKKSSKSLEVPEIKDFWNSLTGGAEDPRVAEFAGQVLSWMTGKLPEIEFDRYVKKVLAPDA